MTIRIRLSSLAIALSLLVPSFAAARPISEFVNPSLPTVSRANFLKWSYEAFALPKRDRTCTLPYKRVPLGMKAILCAAQDADVLSLFEKSKDYVLTKNITRGEAIAMLSVLLEKDEDTNVSAFADVKTAIEKRAVMNAVALKWMVPQGARRFGIHTPLTGSEAMTLIVAASKQSTSPQVTTITVDLSVQQESTLSKQGLLEAVWQILNRDYLHSDKIDADEASYKAIEAIVNAAGDPYTTFFRPINATDFQSQIKGEISGIGAQVEDKGGVVLVVTPLPGSPAEKAGIMPGDEIIEADGVLLTGLGLEKAVSHIRGEKGTSVNLKIRRNGVEMMVRVQRDMISIPEIQVKWQGDIPVIQLAQFGETTDKHIRSIMTDIAKQNPRGIILDLRNNGGGLLSAADTVASNFLPRNTVVAKVQSRRETTEERTESDPTIDPNMKVVVLVNKGSASASEIVAGALQDHKRATIIGTQTFGKGTVQEVIGFRTGEALKVTIAEWLTPLERKLDNIGVKPDIVIEKTSERDEQLQRALDILR